jgi:predicted nucleotidyltransferase
MSKPTYRDYPHLDELMTFVSGVEALKPQLILLFGSVATGECTQRGDTDVLVIFDRPTDWLDVYRFSQGIVQPIVRTVAEVENLIQAGEPFYIQAFLEGVFLAGDEQTYRRLRALVDEAISAHGIIRTKHGWRWDW